MNQKNLTLSLTLIGISCAYATVTSNCPYGYNGDKCDECGLVYVEDNLKIVGGVEAVPYSWPSIIYLTFSYTRIVDFGDGKATTYTFKSFCGGTIIDRKTILTAAHCIINTVYYTDVNGKLVRVRVEPNSFHPTIGSMYSVYVGLYDKSNINNLQYPAVKMSVDKVKRVSLLILKLPNQIENFRLGSRHLNKFSSLFFS